MIRRAALLALLLVACKTPAPARDEAGAPERPLPPAPPGPLPVGSTSATQLFPFDCNGIAPVHDAGTCAAAAARETDALVEFSEKLLELLALHGPPPATWWTPARAALDAASKVVPSSLGVAERVSVQNAALQLALSAKGDLARDAVKLVDRLAFTAAERAQAAAGAVDLSAWLGPAADRTERTRLAPFVHEQFTHQTRVFRLVKTPRLRANFSELIAIDTDGAPFVTAVVGSLEVRRGTGLAAPACVALQSPERVRCGQFDGLLDVRDLTKLPQTHFLRRDERGELRCNDCHGPPGNDPLIGAIDLAPDAVEAELAKHRRATLERLEVLLGPLRRHYPRQ